MLRLSVALFRYVQQNGPELTDVDRVTLAGGARTLSLMLTNPRTPLSLRQQLRELDTEVTGNAIVRIAYAVSSQDPEILPMLKYLKDDYPALVEGYRIVGQQCSESGLDEEQTQHAALGAVMAGLALKRIIDQAQFNALFTSAS